MLHALPCDNENPIELDIPYDMRILPNDWGKQSDGIEDVLYQPRTTNMSAGDSFFVAGGTLVVLQITVNESHQLKYAGLKKIEGFYASVIDRRLVVFVTPCFGTLSVKQEFINTDGNGALNKMLGVNMCTATMYNN